ncbi:MAG: dihydrolipoamide acetyltransferase family protein [Eubacteriales bacterium]|nr:dihydrolipoamide acetyltransferase family protein [Eubacteriales bacterium]
MATAVIMPRQGQSVESCIITEWNKQVGDAVAVGDVLFHYETDKAAFEETAKVAGTLLARFFEVDDDVPCLVNVAVIGAPGDTFSEFAPEGADAPEPAAEVPANASPAVNAAPAITPVLNSAPASEREQRGVSPRAQAAAERLGVNAAQASPTGPNGRVIERDITALAASGTKATPAAMAEMISRRLSGSGTGVGGRITTADIAAGASSAPALPAVEYEDRKLPNVRKVIAKAMQQSLTNAAQLTHTSSFDAANIMALRAQIKSMAETAELPNITLNDMILYACSRVLLRHPDLNAHYLDDRMRYFTHVHLGVAVDTPRGLLVPTLFNADTKSLREISAEAKALIKAAKDGNISPDLLTGATFTVTNLGSLGVEHFTPVINLPQTGILGVNCITDRVRQVNGAITVYPAMGLSLTYDHRALDGAPASRFLMELKTALENFSAYLV